MSSEAGQIKKPVVIGGKLKLKSTAKPSNNNGAPTKVSTSNLLGNTLSGKKRPIEIQAEDVLKQEAELPSESVTQLTDAQKRYKEKSKKLQEARLKKLAEKPFRERIEEFNMKLSKLTEHNDIPRVSAAGNG
jgi:protein FAM32A